MSSPSQKSPMVPYCPQNTSYLPPAPRGVSAHPPQKTITPLSPPVITLSPPKVCLMDLSAKAMPILYFCYSNPPSLWAPLFCFPLASSTDLNRNTAHCYAQEHCHPIHRAPSGAGPPLVWVVIPDPSIMSGIESIVFFLILKHFN